MASDLIDALTGYLTADRNPGPELSFLDNLAVIIDAMGSRRAAGRYLGVGESTLRSWQSGKRPRWKGNIVEHARVAAGERWQRGVYDSAYRGETTLAIRAWVVNSKDVRLRNIYPGRYIPRQSMQYVLRAWIRGDDGTADRVLRNAIFKWYEGCDVGQVESVWFE